MNELMFDQSVAGMSLYADIRRAGCPGWPRRAAGVCTSSAPPSCAWRGMNLDTVSKKPPERPEFRCARLGDQRARTARARPVRGATSSLLPLAQLEAVSRKGAAGDWHGGKAPGL